jgi:hypothetical protein
MPELDFMILADYVRSEGGILHMIAAGIDTIYTTAVPATRMIGLGMRLVYADDEAIEETTLSVAFGPADGDAAMMVNGKLAPNPSQPPVPPGMPRAVVGAFNFPLPLPGYGIFSLGLTLGDSPAKTILVAIAPPPEQPSDAR